MIQENHHLDQETAKLAFLGLVDVGGQQAEKHCRKPQPPAAPDYPALPTGTASVNFLPSRKEIDRLSFPGIDYGNACFVIVASIPRDDGKTVMNGCRCDD